MNASAKNLELQRELGEKQAELTDMQKSAMSAHKQVVRAQRSFNARNSVPEKKEKKAADTLPKEEAAPIPEEVSLDEIKIEQ